MQWRLASCAAAPGFPHRLPMLASLQAIDAVVCGRGMLAQWHLAAATASRPWGRSLRPLALLPAMGVVRPSKSSCGGGGGSGSGSGSSLVRQLPRCAVLYRASSSSAAPARRPGTRGAMASKRGKGGRRGTRKGMQHGVRGHRAHTPRRRQQVLSLSAAIADMESWAADAVSSGNSAASVSVLAGKVAGMVAATSKSPASRHSMWCSWSRSSRAAARWRQNAVPAQGGRARPCECRCGHGVSASGIHRSRAGVGGGGEWVEVQQLSLLALVRSSF